MRQKRKVVVVGAGDVGATFAYALMQEGVAEEIAIVDANTGKAAGQAMDLAHGLPFVPPVRVYAGTAADYADADVVVITAGARQQPDESRLRLVQRNMAIVGSIMDELAASKSNAVAVVVSNPVDVLTYAALERTGWPRERIIGSGTVLDTARFRYLLSEHCGVDARNIHGYILGEHGDSEFAAWSLTHVAGMPISDYCATCNKDRDAETHREAIVEQVRRSAYHIIGYKGSTYYAIGLALVRIVGAILRDENSVLTVSCRLEGEYGLRDVCLSVPCVLSKGGIGRIVVSRLTPREQAALERSASILKESFRQARGSAGSAE
ncbi:MAG: L-lactate dehydrogenase [Kiritimatiellia bacterium]